MSERAGARAKRGTIRVRERHALRAVYLLLLVALVAQVGWIVQGDGFATFSIDSHSMQPTLRPGDELLGASVFVLGDHPAGSEGSAVFAPIAVQRIRFVVWLRYRPWERRCSFESPFVFPECERPAAAPRDR